MTEITGTLSAAFDRDTYRLVLDPDTTYSVRSLSNANIISEDLTVFSVDERGISELFLPYIGLGSTGFDRGDITATFTTLPGRTYFVTFSGNSGFDAEYTLAIDEIADDAPDNAKTTLSLALGESESGEFETVSDRDWVLLDVTPGESYRLTSNFNFLSASLNVIGLDANGNLVRGPFFFPVNTQAADTVNFAAEAGITYYATVNNLGSVLPFNDTLEWVLNLSLLPGDAPNNATTTLELDPGDTITVPWETAADSDWVRLNVTGGDSYAISGETAFQILRVDPTTGIVLDQTAGQSSVSAGNRQTFSAEIGFDYYLQTLDTDGAGLFDYTMVEFEDDAPDNITTSKVLTLENDVTVSSDALQDLDYIRLDLEPGASYRIEGLRSFDGTVVDNGFFVPFQIVSSAEPFGDSFGRTIDPATILATLVHRIGEQSDGRLDYTDETFGQVILSPEAGVTYWAVIENVNATSDVVLQAEIVQDVPDNPTTTTFIAPNSTILGLYEALDDQDWVRVDVDPGQTVLLQITNSLDTTMKIYAVDDATGAIALRQDAGNRPFHDSSTVFSQALVTGEEGVTFYTQITNNRGAQIETYTLSSTPIADDVPDATGDSFLFFSVESETGTEGADFLRGNASNEAFDGLGGNDRILGR
ncbi:MAG: hypothetical protein AAGF44_10745, partial [Pseudomonadota bacterium]